MDADAREALLATAIGRNLARIEDAWLDEVQRDLSRTPGPAPTALRDGVPDYLRALVELLRRRARSEGPVEAAADDANATWSRVAAQHGLTRIRLGVDIRELIREFIVLRHAIQAALDGEGLGGERFGPLLSDLLDGAIAAAVQAYVEARDLETRRRQAEAVGFLTHELRNPLTAAIVITSTLRAHTEAGQLRVLEALERSHCRLAGLIDAVLLAEKLEGGQVLIERVAIALADLIEPALELARRLAAAKGLTFGARYDPTVEVRVDPSLTRSAIQNLADNAVKYTDSGHVNLDVEVTPHAIALHVRDTCHGIAEEDLERVFEPFRRGRSAKEGAGLGLAIARRAIEAQSGSIQAESPHGGPGCHFWLTLPRGTS